jgi:hypothetical protein
MPQAQARIHPGIPGFVRRYNGGINPALQAILTIAGSATYISVIDIFMPKIAIYIAQPAIINIVSARTKPATAAA